MSAKSSTLTTVDPVALERHRFTIGRIVRLEDGYPFVECPEMRGKALKARVTVASPADFDASAPDRIPVLLLIDKDQPTSPIIVGFVNDRLTSFGGKAITQTPDVLLDGRRLVFSASQEIVLRCGKGSIFLGKDGKIIVKGVNIVSRSSGINKVKGAAVKIN
jgi:hypothetical protein